MHSTLNPYLNFGGKARAALEFYQSVFSGELSISTFGDMHVPDAPADGVMHGQLSVEGKPLLMGSDGMDAESFGGFSLSLSGDNEVELRGYFEKLTAGGQITKPLEKEMWGDEFGMVRDQFGITWMINISKLQTA